MFRKLMFSLLMIFVFAFFTMVFHRQSKAELFNIENTELSLLATPTYFDNQSHDSQIESLPSGRLQPGRYQHDVIFHSVQNVLIEKKVSSIYSNNGSEHYLNLGDEIDPDLDLITFFNSVYLNVGDDIDPDDFIAINSFNFINLGIEYDPDSPISEPSNYSGSFVNLGEVIDPDSNYDVKFNQQVISEIINLGNSVDPDIE